MDIVDLLDLLRGDKSQSKFAKELGVSQSHISQVYRGKRKFNRKLFTALLENYPDYKDTILDVFLHSDNHSRY